MFDKEFLEKLKKFAIFLIIYTIIFVVFFSTLSYTLPFVLGIIIAMFTKPLNRFLIKKLKLSRGISALLSTILVFTIVFTILTAFVYKITLESKALLNSLPNIQVATKFVEENINKLRLYYDKIDPSIVVKIQEQLGTMLSTTLDITAKVLSKLVSIAIGLPGILLIVFITFLASFFLTRDIRGIERKSFSILSQEGSKKMQVFSSEANKMIFGYFRAYSFLVSLTFLESFLGFTIINVKYAFILALLSAILDVLPILGIASIYIPLAIIYFLTGNYFIAGSILVLYIIVTIIRQVLEPKLISTSLGLHPVMVLASIFIGIKVYGFVGMIYLISVMVLYNILRKVHIL